MHRFVAMAALAVLGVLAAACSASSSASASPDLPGTSWTVTSVAGVSVDATSPPTIAFGSDGNVSGTTGCNSYNGAYTVDGSKLTLGPLATTLMLCEGDIGAQEMAFSPALQGATAWAIGADGNLTLSGAGDIVATPSAKY